MHPVRVTIKADEGRNRHATPFEIDAFAPFAGSSLVVARVHKWTLREWIGVKGWYVIHVPSGKSLGDVRFKSAEEAMACLERADPAFPAWPVAEASRAALAACKYKWRMATNA